MMMSVVSVRSTLMVHVLPAGSPEMIVLCVSLLLLSVLIGKQCTNASPVVSGKCGHNFHQVSLSVKLSSTADLMASG